MGETACNSHCLGQPMQGEEPAFDAFVETMRTDLKALWGLAENTDVIFAPPGTDAALRALFVAQSVLRAPVIR
jgi:hypothetical protein